MFFKKIKICFILILLLFLFNQQGDGKYNKIRKNNYSINIEDIMFNKCKTYYPWMKKNIYNYISFYCKYWSKNYKIDEELVYALIQHESGGKNIRGRKNRNGSRDHGIMQINEVHSPNDVTRLYNCKINIKIGIWYLSLCIKKSKGNIKEACRMYNQGLYGKKWKYKNWKYVKRIIKDYKKFNKFEMNKDKLFVLN